MMYINLFELGRICVWLLTLIVLVYAILLINKFYICLSTVARLLKDNEAKLNEAINLLPQIEKNVVVITSNLTEIAEDTANTTSKISNIANNKYLILDTVVEFIKVLLNNKESRE